MTRASGHRVLALGGPILLALTVSLMLGTFASVRASPVRCSGPQLTLADDFFRAESTTWVGASGEAVVPDPGLLDPLPDPKGDALNRAGNPTANPDALCAAILKLIEPGAPAVEALGFVDGVDFEVVLPKEPSRELAEATELQAIVVEFGGAFPGTAAGIAQFGISFDSALHPNYSGPELELIGRDTTFDVYLQNGAWTLGRTEYRDGAFVFTANSNQFAAVVGTGRATIFFPEAVVPDDISMVGFFAVSGLGVDVVDIGPFEPTSLLTVARSGAVPTPAPTPTAAVPGTTSPAPTSTPTATPSPGGGGAPTSDGSGDGGLGWLLPIGLAGLALAGGAVVGFALLSRRRHVDATPIGEVAAGVIAADIAMTPLAGRAWKVADPGRSGPRT